MSGGAFEVGTVFAGDYRIERPLASGGMGAVYVARQLSTDRERALKVMLGDLAKNDDLRRRFAQEARVGAQIDSEHVVEVVGAGIDADSGAPWLAMELLQGEDLADYCRKTGPLSAKVVLDLYEQLTHAVGAAHDKGIVHRDLKPENVFLAQTRRAGARFMLKVLDFGIAKLLGQARTSATAAMGTPLWMSPEQTQPGARITPAADVWAMGLIAFYALAGKSFWKSASFAESSAMMVLREVAFEPIPAASERARELGAPPLPAGFDAWFARCVAREPSQRFPDARQMQDALAAVLGSAPAPTASTPSAALPPSGTIAASPIGLTQQAPPAHAQVTDFAAGRSQRVTEARGRSGPGMGVLLAGVAGVAVVGVIVLAATGAFSSGKKKRANASEDRKTASAEKTAAAPHPSASATPPPTVSVASAGPSSASASAMPAGPLSCEEAINRHKEAIAAGTESASTPDTTATTDYARTLNNLAPTLRRCGAADSMGVQVCVAIRNGKAEGVTVKTTPSNATVEKCIEDDVRAKSFTSRPSMDVARTTFAAQGGGAQPPPTKPKPPSPPPPRPPPAGGDIYD